MTGRVVMSMNEELVQRQHDPLLHVPLLHQRLQEKLQNVGRVEGEPVEAKIATGREDDVFHPRPQRRADVEPMQEAVLVQKVLVLF